ncbi:MAG: 2-hydroxyacyl-CoA dehydratase [Desulfobacterales bacterium]|nr:2-hydroxyacyl-CoA dehydratase [Desulfobacterales bacterium]
MRNETTEYKLEWMLRSIFANASKAGKSTGKEYAHFTRHLPHYRNILGVFDELGEAGYAYLKLAEMYLDNIIKAKERGQLKALTSFNINPAIFYAMDIVPICIEVVTVMCTLLWERGTADYLDFCVEAGFTETSCSAQRGALGAYLAGLAEDVDLVMNNSAGICDTNANAFSFAAAYLDKPFYQLDSLSELTSDTAIDYHRVDYRAFIDFLEEHSGAKLEIGRFREAMEEVRLQEEIYCELEELQMLKPSPVPIEFSFMAYTIAFLLAGNKEATGVLKLILKKSRENAENGVSGLKFGKEKLRALPCYIDHYTLNMNYWQMLNKYGITHLGNILTRSWNDNAPLPKYLGDKKESYELRTTGELDELIDVMGMMNARMPMAKSIRGPYDSPNMWLEDNLALAKMYDPDFIIYIGTPGCRNTWGMVKLFARDMERNGYPIFIMNADAFDDRVESWEASEARLDEFLRVRRLIQ